MDAAQFDYYGSLSHLQQSKLEIMKNATFVGKNYVHPMYYAGGMELIYNNLEMVFGIDRNSGSFRSPKEFWEEEYSRISGKYDAMMSQAGVSN